MCFKKKKIGLKLEYFGDKILFKSYQSWLNQQLLNMMFPEEYNSFLVINVTDKCTQFFTDKQQPEFILFSFNNL